jgi:hypothetical protein
MSLAVMKFAQIVCCGKKNWMKQEEKKKIHQIALKAGAAEGKTELEYIVRC